MILNTFVTPSAQTKMADVDKWIEVAKECKYLPENDLKVGNNTTHISKPKQTREKP